MFPPLWLFLAPVVILVASAGQTNHTIDDASGLVDYVPFGISRMGCGGCSSAEELHDAVLDGSKLENGTFSSFATGLAFDEDTGMEFNFTGTAVYIFLAVAPAPSGVEVPSSPIMFFVDGVLVGTRNSFGDLPEAEYNISAYANRSIADGFHTFRMTVPGPVIFDYAVYTSNDDELVSSSSSASQPSSVSLPTAAPHISSSSSAQNTAPVAAIAGGVVGAVALIFGAVVAFFFMRRAQRKNDRWRNTLSIEEGSAAGSFLPVTTRPAVQDATAAGRFHALQQQIRRLEQRVEGSSSTGSDTASLGRSLSTMKREQTRALQEQGPGRTVTETLVHTDSGLRLTTGREEEEVVDELPPTYVAD
ncbi:hypothetical protein C8R47DRAFT_1229647 [Mycena vitilis]|nr:hypothetical protein C8R47DRAFT_1229647 [Mycena vitilis]